MARLTDEESALLKKLMGKRDAPDEPSIGRSLNVSIDLGDEKQLRRARKLGLIDAYDDDDGDGDGGGDGGKGRDDDDPPKRRGFFGE